MPERLVSTRARRAAVTAPPRRSAPPPHRRHPEPDTEPNMDRSERFTLIEFVWEHASGAQPVLFLSRELLH